MRSKYWFSRISSIASPQPFLIASMKNCNYFPLFHQWLIQSQLMAKNPSINQSSHRQFIFLKILCWPIIGQRGAFWFEECMSNMLEDVVEFFFMKMWLVICSKYTWMTSHASPVKSNYTKVTSLMYSIVYENTT